MLIVTLYGSPFQEYSGTKAGSITSRVQNSGSDVQIEHLILHDWLISHAAFCLGMAVSGIESKTE